MIVRIMNVVIYKHQTAVTSKQLKSQGHAARRSQIVTKCGNSDPLPHTRSRLVTCVTPVGYRYVRDIRKLYTQPTDLYKNEIKLTGYNGYYRVVINYYNYNYNSCT